MCSKAGVANLASLEHGAPRSKQQSTFSMYEPLSTVAMGLAVTHGASLMISIFKSRDSTSECGIEACVGVDPTGAGSVTHARKGSSRAQRNITPEYLSGRWESKSSFVIASTLAPFSGGMEQGSTYESKRHTLD